jgi:hypothetical protein
MEAAFSALINELSRKNPWKPHLQKIIREISRKKPWKPHLKW